MREKWRRLKGREEAAAFLKREEPLCVNAVSRFRAQGRDDRLWTFHGGGELRGLVILSRGALFPVLQAGNQFPPPRFLIRSLPVHILQGKRDDAAVFQTALDRLGLNLHETIDYDIMVLDQPSPAAALKAGPPSLVLRPPSPLEREALFPLQAAYEREEVLPQNAVFNPAACRLSLERILHCEQVLAAELGGRLVGKINTNAEAFTRFQIGGVYVLPEYRGRGIATRMTAALALCLLAQDKTVSLFVNKKNERARSVYLRAGFKIAGDYRICYYEEEL